ncbi:MAG TPA: hypothetical protein VF755_13060 [Catenuloplanes sp.]
MTASRSRVGFRDLRPGTKALFVISVTAVAFGAVLIVAAVVAAVLITLGSVRHGVAVAWS